MGAEASLAETEVVLASGASLRTPAAWKKSSEGEDGEEGEKASATSAVKATSAATEVTTTEEAAAEEDDEEERCPLCLLAERPTSTTRAVLASWRSQDAASAPSAPVPPVTTAVGVEDEGREGGEEVRASGTSRGLLTAALDSDVPNGEE